MEAREPMAARVVAVFRDRDAAEQGADEIRRTSSGTLRVRIDEPADAIESLRGEMREEVEKTVFAPGNVGPFTAEMTRRLVPAMLVATVAGALVGLPFALIPMGGLPLWSRIVITMLVGGAAGWTVGFTAGGGFGETDVENTKLAAERGVVVAVDGADARTIEAAAKRLAAHGALRVDTLDREDSPFEAYSADETPTQRQRRSGRL